MVEKSSATAVELVLWALDHDKLPPLLFFACRCCLGDEVRGSRVDFSSFSFFEFDSI